MSLQVMQASFGGALSSLYGRRFALAVASPVDACSPMNNSTPVNGTIVLIQRGACFMSIKVSCMHYASLHLSRTHLQLHCLLPWFKTDCFT